MIRTTTNRSAGSCASSALLRATTQLKRDLPNPTDPNRRPPSFWSARIGPACNAPAAERAVSGHFELLSSASRGGTRESYGGGATPCNTRSKNRCAIGVNYCHYRGSASFIPLTAPTGSGTERPTASGSKGYPNSVCLASKLIFNSENWFISWLA